jgi:hypothetical protein
LRVSVCDPRDVVDGSRLTPNDHRAVLEGLDDVPWQALSHAFGPASDVPDLIRALAGPDSEARREAVAELFGTIWHQGTVYDATAPAVPFLAALARRPQTADRRELLVLLGVIAGGSGYLEVHHRVVGATERALADEAAWVARAREAVRAELPALLALLADPDPTVRAATAAVAARVPAERELSVSRLRTTAAAEADERLLLTYEVALKLLGENVEIDVEMVASAVASTWGDVAEVRDSVAALEHGDRSALDELLVDLAASV